MAAGNSRPSPASPGDRVQAYRDVAKTLSARGPKLHWIPASLLYLIGSGGAQLFERAAFPRAEVDFSQFVADFGRGSRERERGHLNAATRRARQHALQRVTCKRHVQRGGLRAPDWRERRIVVREETTRKIELSCTVPAYDDYRQDAASTRDIVWSIPIRRSKLAKEYCRSTNARQLARTASRSHQQTVTTASAIASSCGSLSIPTSGGSVLGSVSLPISNMFVERRDAMTGKPAASASIAESESACPIDRSPH